MKTKFLFLAIILLVGINAYSQVGINTSTPDQTSILDISSTSKGLLIPRMTTVQRDAISNPSNGLQIFNLDTKCMDFYFTSSSSWNNVCPQPRNFVPKFIAFRTTDLTGMTNNVRYNISFNDVLVDDLAAFGGSYNPSTGGVTLSPGVYEISYGLVAMSNEADFQNTPDLADVFISSFENTSGNVAGTEIQGTIMQDNHGTTVNLVRNSSAINTFYMRVGTTQTYYLKGKFFNGTGGIISANQVFVGNGTYNKPHLNNFITIKKLVP